MAESGSKVMAIDTFVDNGVIGGVPCNIQMIRNTGYRQVIQYDGSQGPAYCPMGKL